MKISRIGIVAILSAVMIFGFTSCDISVISSDSTYQFHSTVTYLAAGTNGTAGTKATYCYFGDWPQTIKEGSVTVDETKSVTRGSMTYYLGSDSNYYVKCTEYGWGMATYSDGTPVAPSGANNTKYFRVEPIKWLVLNPSASGNKILVAESILTSNIPYYGSRSYRTLNEITIEPNNYKYSNIRAYLNGTKNQFVTDGGTATEYDVDWTGKGFLQTAFTSSAQSLIATTTVDNSEASTNRFACEDTSDKIFLLSKKEATTTDYGFTAYNQSGTETSCIRVTTDYAKANYAYQYTSAVCYSRWWLRSPFDDGHDYARYCAISIYESGYAIYAEGIGSEIVGVVPALCLK